MVISGVNCHVEETLLVERRFTMLSTGNLLSNSKKSKHFLVMCCRLNNSNLLIAYDLVSEESSDINNPNLALPITADMIMTKVGSRGIIYGRQWTLLGNPNQMWLLRLSDDCRWSIENMPLPKLSPVKPRVLSIGGVMQTQQEILLYGGVTLNEINYVNKLAYRLYRLDLKTSQWSTDMLTFGGSGTKELYFEVFSTATVLFGSVLVVYGGLDHVQTEGGSWGFNLEPLVDVKGYYNQMTARLWIKYSTKGDKPSGRIFHASTAIDAQTMVIYGGITLYCKLATKFLHDF